MLFAAGLGAVATAPLMAILTTRAPDELRAKVMTAVITIVTISGPVTVLVLGRLLESIDVRTMLLALAIGRVVHGRRLRDDRAAAGETRRCRRLPERR